MNIRFLLVAFALLALPVRCWAQDAPVPPPGWIGAPTTIGGDAEDRLRLRQVLGEAGSEGFLIRSTSSLLDFPGSDSVGFRFGVLLPRLDVVWNSDIPFSLNQDALWAGRGLSSAVRAGVQLTYGGVRAVLAPVLTYAQNLEFDDAIPAAWRDSVGIGFIPPWQQGKHSADIPYRLGEDPILALHWGESALAIHAGTLVVGAATESQWWGPGLRNAIVMSNNAPGVPHLFLRTDAPLQTALGEVEAKWMAGALRESGYFHEARDSPDRSLSAFALTLRPAVEPGLTLGLARAVYASEEGIGGIAGNAADAFIRWEGRSPADSVPEFEQILSLFGRWILPADGVELYAEWARHELPGSFRDLLTAPEHSQGYTLGLQWARAVPAGGLLRVQAEHTYLEQSPTFRARPIGSFYASRVIPQGYTHRGRVVGAAIGPGASSQWLAADLLGGDWRIGLFGGRIRWANDAYYDNPAGHARYHGHDVTVLGGVRTGAPFAGMWLSAEWTLGRRLNYLFQSRATDWHDRSNTVDVLNHTLHFSISPALTSR